MVLVFGQYLAAVKPNSLAVRALADAETRVVALKKVTSSGGITND